MHVKCTVSTEPTNPLTYKPADLLRKNDRRSPTIHPRTDRIPRTRPRLRARSPRGLGSHARLRRRSQIRPRKSLRLRGDVTITLKSGEKIEAYIFNRSTGPTLAESWVQYFAPNATDKCKISYDQIARLEFGKDRAAGKHWEDWVKAWNQKKAAGETNIGLAPDNLD